jgi:CRISPR-associated protein Csb1
MPVDVSSLDKESRLLFTIGLKPMQGDRFQPTGFPGLGAATYQTADGVKLLVESAQSMANRMEAACWDFTRNSPISVLHGVSHVTVKRKGAFLTDTMLEAHRLNSPYLLESKKNKSFATRLAGELQCLEAGPIDRKLLARTLLRYDVGCLLHGVFLAKRDLAGGRLRVPRALSSFIEASGARVVASGGVKNDHVNPSGVTKDGFGNVPYARDEFTADRIECHFNLDLSQIRGYGLGPKAERLLVLLALHRVRRLLDGDLRLRTACDLSPVDRASITASRPAAFPLPTLHDLEADLPGAIAECSEMMDVTETVFDDELKKGKEEEEEGDHAEAAGD